MPDLWRAGASPQHCGRGDAHDIHEWYERGIFRRECDGTPKEDSDG